MSGMQVTFDLSQPSGSRVSKVLVLCSNCTDPKYEPLNLRKTYKIIVNEFLSYGGNGFDMLVVRLRVT